MAYVKIIFQNSPSTATPLNAQNLNHMDDQIALNDQRLTDLEGAHVSSFNSRTGAVVSADGDYDIGQITPLSGAQVGQVPVVTNIGTEEDPKLVFRMGAGGGAGGHEIIASDGTQMPQEPSLFLKDIHTSDDSVHLRTELEMIKNIVKADLANVTEDGIYQTTDEEDVPIGDIEEDSVSVTASSDTYRSLINKLRDEIDFSKLTQEAYIMLGTNKFVLVHFENGEYQFTNAIAYSTSALATIFLLENTNGQYRDCFLAQNSGAVNTDKSTSSITDGTVITLYYGTSSTIINLKTDARDCMLSDGVTSVESAFAFEDITSQCTLYSGLSGTVVLYNKTLKMVRVQGILASGTPNGTTIITLPNTIKANGVQLLAQKYDTSDGKTITCVITDNSSNIVTEYSVSADAGVAQVMTAFLMCK